MSVCSAHACVVVATLEAMFVRSKAGTAGANRLPATLDTHVTLSCAGEDETWGTSQIWSLAAIREYGMRITTSREREVGAAIVCRHCP